MHVRVHVQQCFVFLGGNGSMEDVQMGTDAGWLISGEDFLEKITHNGEMQHLILKEVPHANHTEMRYNDTQNTMIHKTRCFTMD